MKLILGTAMVCAGLLTGCIATASADTISVPESRIPIEEGLFLSGTGNWVEIIEITESGWGLFMTYMEDVDWCPHGDIIEIVHRGSTVDTVLFAPCWDSDGEKGANTGTALYFDDHGGMPLGSYAVHVNVEDERQWEIWISLQEDSNEQGDTD